MPQTIKEFLARPDIKEIKEGHTLGQNTSVDFFRDPLRPITYDPDLLYAPADGVVLYALPRVKPKDFLEIKGKNFTLQEMLADGEYNEPSLVVGIFMTALDVHINRVPSSSYFIDQRKTEYIYTHNISMMLAENELLEDFGYKKDALSYLLSNEKKVSVFYSPDLRSRYYIVQVGDKDIDCILSWGKGHFLLQGDRFGQIRWGSQCDLVCPLNGRTEYEVLVEPLQHVEAGVDAIAKVVGRK